MRVYEAAKSFKNVRAFDQKPVADYILAELIDHARLSPSSANLQPLEYLVITKKELRDEVFDYCIEWEAEENPGSIPLTGQRPAVYIAVLIREDYKRINVPKYDVGAAFATIALLAEENGLGTSWIMSMDQARLAGLINLPKNASLSCVVALGYPK